MTLSEIEISGADVQTDELIRLAGGILKIGTGLRLSGGQILFEHPDTAQAVELLALPEDTLVLSFAAGENGFKASFDAGARRRGGLHAGRAGEACPDPIVTGCDSRLEPDGPRGTTRASSRRVRR